LTFVIEIFGHQLGTVGFTEKLAWEKGLDVVTTTISNPSTRPQYGGKLFHYKLIADRKTQTLIGAQIISEEKIRGLVNEMALAVAEKVPLHRLALLETPYSPAVGRDLIIDGVTRLVNELG
jgi:pyruvate/2-oxoglutarate dehydrogenase complex dihydrolipoamide dehydrogenase (E3) component